MTRKFQIYAGLAALAVAGGGLYILSDRHAGHEMAKRLTDGAPVILPQLTANATEGQGLFAENCAVCHGKNAVGTEQGPPLIHIIYETGHHGDPSFYRAVAQGVRGHHWRFGDMPAIDGVSEAEVGKIIAYIRETQRANGIN